MLRVGSDYSTVGKPSREESPFIWWAIMVIVFLSLLVAAAMSWGLVDRLSPNNEPFVPYYVT
jgi:hypothetical protein